MDRRKLIVRRFGVLSFGLGYFEDGVWIDHLAAPSGETDAAEMGAIHAWLDCCGDRPDGRLAALAVEARNGTPREPVAAAGRSATS
jgi:hypothetical protein